MTKEQYEKWETGDVLVSMEDILNENAFFPYTKENALNEWHTNEKYDYWKDDYEFNDVFFDKNKFMEKYPRLDEIKTQDGNNIILHGEIYC